MRSGARTWRGGRRQPTGSSPRRTAAAGGPPTRSRWQQALWTAPHASSHAQVLPDWGGVPEPACLPACLNACAWPACDLAVASLAWNAAVTTALDEQLLATVPMLEAECAGWHPGAPWSLRCAWLAGKLLQTLTGHTDRLAKIAFHPMAAHLVSLALRGPFQEAHFAHPLYKRMCEGLFSGRSCRQAAASVAAHKG
jgi:hypothetical protein